MRKDIVDLSHKLEVYRVRNMAWWPESDTYKEERAASEPVFQAYEAARADMCPEMRRLLDQMEEEWYLLKEAELQATYLQGISDCLDYLQKEDDFKQVS